MSEDRTAGPILKNLNCIHSTQLTGLCRVCYAEYYFENFVLYNITWAEHRIVQSLYLFELVTSNFIKYSIQINVEI